MATKELIKDMNKTKAHIILCIFDILTIIALIWLYNTNVELYHTINNNEPMIEFNNQMYKLIICIIIPICHIFSIIEHFIPERINYSLFSKLIIGLFCSLIIFSIFIPYYLNKKLVVKGYFYCEKKSKSSFFSKHVVFINDESFCN